MTFDPDIFDPFIFDTEEDGFTLTIHGARVSDVDVSFDDAGATVTARVLRE